MVAPFQPAARLWVTPPVPGPYHPIELRQASGETVAGGLRRGRREAVRVKHTDSKAGMSSLIERGLFSLHSASPEVLPLGRFNVLPQGRRRRAV